MKIAWLVQEFDSFSFCGGPPEFHKHFPEYMTDCYKVTQIVYQEVIEDDD